MKKNKRAENLPKLRPSMILIWNFLRFYIFPNQVEPLSQLLLDS